MKVYVCGPVSGVEDRNVEAFEGARRRLRALGHEVVIPHDVVPADMSDDTERGEIMRRCLTAMLGCDEVVALPGYECSDGSVQELRVAQVAGMVTLPLDIAEVTRQ